MSIPQRRSLAKSLCMPHNYTFLTWPMCGRYGQCDVWPFASRFSWLYSRPWLHIEHIAERKPTSTYEMEALSHHIHPPYNILMNASHMRLIVPTWITCNYLFPIIKISPNQDDISNHLESRHKPNHPPLYVSIKSAFCTTPETKRPMHFL